MTDYKVYPLQPLVFNYEGKKSDYKLEFKTTDRSPDFQEKYGHMYKTFRVFPEVYFPLVEKRPEMGALLEILTSVYEYITLQKTSRSIYLKKLPDIEKQYGQIRHKFFSYDKGSMTILGKAFVPVPRKWVVDRNIYYMMFSVVGATDLISTSFDEQKYFSLTSIVKEDLVDGVYFPYSDFPMTCRLYRSKKVKFPIKNKFYSFYNPMYEREKFEVKEIDPRKLSSQGYDIDYRLHPVKTPEDINRVFETTGKVDLCYFRDYSIKSDYLYLSEHITVFRILVDGLLGLKILKEGGHMFFYEINHLSLEPSVQLLYIFSNYFKELVIMRPQLADAHKRLTFFVFKHFKGISDSEYAKLEDILKQWNKYDPAFSEKLNNKNSVTNKRKGFLYESKFDPKRHNTKFVSSLLSTKLPAEFVNIVKTANTAMSELYYSKYLQMKDLFDRMSKLDKKALDKEADRILTMNINSCIHWCLTAGFDINALYDQGPILVTRDTYLKNYFPEEPGVDMTKLMVSPYTSGGLSNTVTIIPKILRLMSKHIDTTPKKTVITDATAYLGSFSIYASAKYRFINAVTIHPTRCDIIKNNLKVYRRTNTRVYCANYTDIDHTITQDVIFMEPQTQYPQFKGAVFQNIYYAGHPVGSFIERLLSKTRLVVLVLPVTTMLYNVFRETNIKTFTIYKVEDFVIVMIKGELGRSPQNKNKVIKGIDVSKNELRALQFGE
jgi:hypothetical protein